MRTPSDTILRKIKQTWSLSQKFRFIRKVENWIYKDEEKALFIRVTEPSHRSKLQLEAELNWMFYLQQKGIQLVHPLPSPKGHLVEKFSDDHEEFYVSVFEEAAGQPLIGKEDFTPNRLKNWGKLIGSLHSAAANYQKPSNIESRPDWETERTFFYNQDIFISANPLYNHYQKFLTWLYSLPQTKQNFGLIHADIHQGNFFVDENDQFTLFDFDDCHNNWFVYDIATPLFGLSMSMRKSCPPEEIAQMHEYLLEGYQEKGCLTEEDLGLLPHFILFRHFSIYSFAQKNLENNTLSDNTKDWMHMAIKYCGDFIENYDFESLNI